MLRQPKNLMDSLMPLMTMYALIGHGIFRCPVHQQRPVLSAIYAVLFAVLYLVVFAFTLDFVFNEPWYGDDERIVFLIIYVNVGISIIGVLLSWCNAKRFACIIEDLTKVDDTLRELGASFDYARVRNEGYGIIFIWVVVIIFFDWIDTLWFLDVNSATQIYIIASVLHHPVHINSMIAFNFCVGIRLVGERYKKANTILESLGRSAVQEIKFNAWQHPKRKTTVEFMFAISKFQTRQILRKPENRKYLIQIIKHVHLELNKVARRLNEVYGIQMALEVAALFIMFTGLLYELYILAFKSLVVGRLLRIVVIGTWIFLYFLKLMLINEICERVCTEARRTGEIIYCLDDNNADPKMRNEINQFSLQLLHDSVAFCPGGLITLGHRFITNFLATVTTYLVILIQMTPQKST